MEFLKKAGSAIGITYLIITSTIFVPYYNYRYAKDAGFVEWLFFGEIVATAKATVWPYYIYKSLTSPNKPKRESLLPVSIQTYLTATETFARVLTKAKEKEYSSKDEMMAELRAVREMANAVDIGVLNEHYPGWGTVFRDTVIEALALSFEGFETANEVKFTQADAKLAAWNRWLNDNAEKLGEALDDRYDRPR